MSTPQDPWGRHGGPGWGPPPPHPGWAAPTSGGPQPGGPQQHGDGSGWPLPGGWPPPEGPSSGGKGPLFAALGGVVLLVVLAVVAVTTLAGDGDEPVGQPATPSSVRPTVTATVPGTTPTAQPTTPVDENGTTDVEVGECVELLVATGEQAEVVPVDCAAPQASHLVVAQVTNRVDCPGDIDITYYETSFDIETLALCMDVNWKIGACYDITYGPASAEQVGCAAQPGREIAQVESVQQDTTTSDGCSERGFAYTQRRFVVCTVAVQ